MKDERKKKHKKRSSSPPQQHVDVDVAYKVTQKVSSSKVTANGMLMVRIPVSCTLPQLKKLMHKEYLSGIRAVSSLCMFEMDISIKVGEKEYNAVSEMAWQCTFTKLVRGEASCPCI